MKKSTLSNKSRTNSKYIFDLDLTLYSEKDYKDTENQKGFEQIVFPNTLQCLPHKQYGFTGL